MSTVFNPRAKDFLTMLTQGSMVTPGGRVDGFFPHAAREIFNPDPPSVKVRKHVL